MARAVFSMPGGRRPRNRSGVPAVALIALAAAVAAAWPMLVAVPLVGGPVVTLAAGVVAWTIARAAAPLPHANDNRPLASSPTGVSYGRPKPPQAGGRMIFGGNAKSPPPRRAGGLSVIGADVTVTGNVATEGDLHVDGTIEGDVRCGSLVQGQSGRIVGSIVAKSARIAGTIEGRISADTLTIEKAARLRGDSDYRTLQIEIGAQVDGRMTHSQGDAKDSPLRLVDGSGALG